MVEYVVLYGKTKDIKTDNLAIDKDETKASVYKDDIQYNTDRLIYHLSKVNDDLVNSESIINPSLLLQRVKNQDQLNEIKKYISKQMYNKYYKYLLNDDVLNIDMIDILELVHHNNLKAKYINNGLHFNLFNKYYSSTIKEPYDLYVDISDDSNKDKLTKINIINSTSCIVKVDIIKQDVVGLLYSLIKSYRLAYLYKSQYSGRLNTYAYLVLINKQNPYMQLEPTEDFVYKIETFFSTVARNLKNYVKTIENFKDKYMKIDDDEKKAVIDLAHIFRIKKAVKYLKSIQLNVPDFLYKDNQHITYDKTYIPRTYFPYKKDLDYTKIRISEEGLYSISRPYLGKEIIDIIKTYYDPSDYVVTEVGGGNGGDSINLCKNYKFVNIVEKNSEHCDIIKHNLKLYNISNFKVYNNGYEDIINDLKQHTIFMDPLGEVESCKKTKELI